MLFHMVVYICEQCSPECLIVTLIPQYQSLNTQIITSAIPPLRIIISFQLGLLISTNKKLIIKLKKNKTIQFICGHPTNCEHPTFNN